MTKHERIQYAPDDETESAIKGLIQEIQYDKQITLTRGQALSHFVLRGVRDWKEKRNKEAQRQSAYDKLSEIGHRKADRAQ